MEASVQYNSADLHRLAKMLDFGRGHVIRVGIFGSKNTAHRPAVGKSRNSKGERKTKGIQTSALTNAEVGAKHEYGDLSGKPPIPARSFLRMPIWMKQKEIMGRVGKVTWRFLEHGDIMGLLKRFGLECENVVQDAFSTGGFGQWSPLSDVTKKRKGSDAILIDTGQLRRSIASDVVKD
jgi:phage gpG-like protein